MRRGSGVLIAIVCLVAACSSSSKDSGDKIPVTDERGKSEVTIVVKDNVFEPQGVRVDPGTRVTLVNEGRSPHDIVTGDPAKAYETRFAVDAASFKPGQSYSYTFTKPGVFPFYCELHGSATKGMTGVVVVGDAEFDGHIRTTENAGTQSGTLHVPADYPTIQKAVDAAKPGSLVLVAPGVYKEAVTVNNPRHRDPRREPQGHDRRRGVHKRQRLQSAGRRGRDREHDPRNYTKNGFFWTGVKGYRGSYLTAVRNGDYGIYAFASTHGQFDDDYGAGSPDAGFYIGQCYPCNAVITDSLAEWNGIGYSGTNAGGELLIVNSTWRNNRVGIVPNSETGEANPPQRKATVVGNTVYANNNTKTAAIEIAETAFGNGILLAGGVDDIVERNLVYDHDGYGIGAIPLPEKVLDPDNKNAKNFDARGNRVRNNVVSDSRAADLALITTLDNAKDTGGNCFSGNTYRTSSPPRDRGARSLRRACVGGVQRRHRRVRHIVHRVEAQGRRLQDRCASGATRPRGDAESDHRARGSGRSRRSDAGRYRGDHSAEEVASAPVGSRTDCHRRGAVAERCRSPRHCSCGCSCPWCSGVTSSFPRATATQCSQSRA